MTSFHHSNYIVLCIPGHTYVPCRGINNNAWHRVKVNVLAVADDDDDDDDRDGKE